MFCCVEEAKTLEDLPEELLARFFALLAEAQERRPDLWRLPARCLAEILRSEYYERFVRTLTRED